MAEHGATRSRRWSSANEALWAAAADFTVLWATGDAAETDLPGGVISQLICRVGNLAAPFPLLAQEGAVGLQRAPSAGRCSFSWACCTRVAEGYAPTVPKLRAAVQALRTGDLVDIGMPIALLGFLGAEDLWDDDAYRAVVGRFIAVSREQGAVRSLAVVLINLAAAEIWAGRFSSAESCYEEADVIFRSVVNVAFGVSPLVEVRAWQDRETDLRAGADIAIQVWGEQLGPLRPHQI